ERLLEQVLERDPEAQGELLHRAADAVRSRGRRAATGARNAPGAAGIPAGAAMVAAGRRADDFTRRRVRLRTAPRRRLRRRLEHPTRGRRGDDPAARLA